MLRWDWWEEGVCPAGIGGRLQPRCCDWLEAGVLCCDWWHLCPPLPMTGGSCAPSAVIGGREVCFVAIGWRQMHTLLQLVAPFSSSAVIGRSLVPHATIGGRQVSVLP